LHIGSSYYSLLLALFFGLNQLILALKQVPCRFSLNLPFFGVFNFHVKPFRPSYGFQSIGMLNFVAP
jgi:hypothetical protein